MAIIKFNDIKNFSDFFRYFDLELVQLEEADCNASLIQTALDDIYIQHAWVNFSLEYKACIEKDYYSFSIIDAPPKQLHNGSILNGNCFIVNKPMQEYSGFAQKSHRSVTIHIPKKIVESIFTNLKSGIFKENSFVVELKKLLFQLPYANLLDKNNVYYYNNLILEKIGLILLNPNYFNNQHYYYKVLKKITKYMKSNSKNNLTMIEISSKFKITDRTLRNIFMHQVGISPKQYQKAIQLNLLKDEILKNKKSNITECIIESGMGSHSLVSKNFKSYFKMTPSEFKNATR